MKRPVKGGGTIASDAITTVRNVRNESARARLRSGPCEVALERPSEGYRSLVEHLPDIVWTSDASGRTVYVSPNVTTLYGFTPEEIYAGGDELWFGRIDPSQSAAVRAAYQALIDDGQAFDMEYRILRKDGIWIWLHDRSTKTYEQSGQRFADGIATEITARKLLENQRAVRLAQERAARRAAERMEARAEFLAHATAVVSQSLDYDETLEAVVRLAVPSFADGSLYFAATPEGPLRLVAHAHRDPDGQLRMEDYLRTRGVELDGLDRLVAEAFGLDRPSVFATHDALNRFRPDDARCVDPIDALAMNALLACPLVSHGLRLGVIVWYAGESERVFGPEDVTLSREVAERIAAAIDHALLFRSAQRAIRSRDDVVALVSHDLKNPLNAIGLHASSIRRLAVEQTIPPEVVDHAERIQRGVRQMNTLLADLLDAASIEAGRFAIRPSPIAVETLLDEARDLMGGIAGERGVVLEIEAIDGRAPTIHCDPNRILQVLSNLLGNAVKFSPRGTVVRVMVALEPTAVVLSVSDGGPGIAPADRERVFERFWRGETRDRHGAGLGLFIARTIVEAHGGTIWVESTPGVGATFSFRLPSGPTIAANA